MSRSCFCIILATLCLSVVAFSPCTLTVTIDRCILITILFGVFVNSSFLFLLLLLFSSHLKTDFGVMDGFLSLFPYHRFLVCGYHEDSI